MANLQNNTYTNMNTGTNSGNKMPFDVIYDPVLLVRATQNLMFDRFAGTKFVDAEHSGVKEAFAFRFRNMRPATTPLTEGIAPAESQIYREKVRWSFDQYGSFITFTDVFDIIDVHKVKSEFIDVLGDQAKETLDCIVRDVISSGTRVIYAGNGTDRDSVANNGSALITKENLELVVLNLKNARAKKMKKIVSGSTNTDTKTIRDAYICITHPNVINDLKNLEGWVGVEKYTAAAKDIMADEVGSWGEIRFIEDTNALVASSGANPVYITLVFGENAYVTTTIRGKGGIKSIYKPVSSGGAENPLNQKGSVGWKVFAGAKIIDQLNIIRLESNASINVPNLIRYGDTSDAQEVNDETPISEG